MVNALCRTGRKFVALLTATVIAVSLIGLTPTTVHAAVGDVSVYITEVTRFDDGATGNQIIRVTGEVLNVGDTAVENIEIVLGSTERISGREELHNFLDSREEAQLTPTDISAKIKRVSENSKLGWQITFVPQNILALPNGVYGFGVIAQSGEILGTDVFALPVFAQLPASPVNLVLAVQLSTLNSHLASGGISLSDETELDRLINLVLNNQELEISWIVDPALPQWLNELINTELTDKATLLLDLLNSITERSSPSLYGQPDVARLLASNRDRDLTNLVVRTAQTTGTNSIVFTPESGRTTNAVINIFRELGVRPILSNEFLTGDKFNSVDASSIIGRTAVLISDTGLASCLQSELKDPVTSFRGGNCLQSELALIASDQPTNTLVLTPTNWNPSAETIGALAVSLSGKGWISPISIKQFLNSVPIAEQVLPADFEVDPFDVSLIETGDAISVNSLLTSSIFLDESYSDGFNLARLRGFSSLWPTGDQATSFLQANLDLLLGYQDALAIDASRNITVSNLNTEIPITVVNTSDRDISVVVALSSPFSSRFSSLPSQVVTIPSGKRITIPMEIFLVGDGILNVQASLFAPNGQAIGKSKLIQISSAEYQGFARTLVLVAFGLLLLLSISNIARRRSGKQN